jgi:hypothetical protein
MKSRFIVSLDIAQDTLARRVLRLIESPLERSRSRFTNTISLGRFLRSRSRFHEHDVRFGGFAQFQHATQIGETIAACQFERFERSVAVEPFDKLRAG